MPIQPFGQSMQPPSPMDLLGLAMRQKQMQMQQIRDVFNMRMAAEQSRRAEAQLALQQEQSRRAAEEMARGQQGRQAIADLYQATTMPLNAQERQALEQAQAEAIAPPAQRPVQAAPAQTMLDALENKFIQQKQQRIETAGEEAFRTGAISPESRIGQQLFGFTNQEPEIKYQDFTADGYVRLIPGRPPEYVPWDTPRPTSRLMQARETAALRRNIEDQLEHGFVDPDQYNTYSGMVSSVDPYLRLATLNNWKQHGIPVNDTEIQTLNAELLKKRFMPKQVVIPNADGSASIRVYNALDWAMNPTESEPVATFVGDAKTWSEGAMSDAQKKYVGGTMTLRSMERIKEMYNSDANYFTYWSRGKVLGQEIAQKLNISIPEAERMWKYKRDMLLRSIEDAFQQWRIAVTGAQASDREIETLRRNFINGTLSGPRIEAFFQSIVGDTLNRMDAFETLGLVRTHFSTPLQTNPYLKNDAGFVDPMIYADPERNPSMKDTDDGIKVWQ